MDFFSSLRASLLDFLLRQTIWFYVALVNNYLFFILIKWKNSAADSSQYLTFFFPRFKTVGHHLYLWLERTFFWGPAPSAGSAPHSVLCTLFDFWQLSFWVAFQCLWGYYLSCFTLSFNFDVSYFSSSELPQCFALIPWLLVDTSVCSLNWML